MFYFVINVEMLISEAAQIGYDQMLQEDFASPLKRVLAWYSCELHRQNTAEKVAQYENERETERLEQLEKDKEEVRSKMRHLRD